MQAPLRGDWPEPVEVLNERGASDIVLLCEHASNHIPSEYAGLGLPQAELGRHIAWDIGADALTRRLSALLDAPAFLAAYSRLLIDLNRPLNAASLIPQRSEATDITGNLELSPADRQRRIEKMFLPFHGRVAEHLDQRQQQRRPTLLISVHSFTPVYLGKARPWRAGILFDQARLPGESLVELLRADGEPSVDANVPYSVSPDSDYAIPIHGDVRGLEAVLIEIRNDGLLNERDVEDWAQRLARALRAAKSRIRSV